MSEKEGGGGYGNPPKEHQFKPGQSGNPAGRPKGAKNKRPSKGLTNSLTEMVLSEADRLLHLSERGERLELPTAQVILRRMVNDAVKGSHRAQREFLKMASAAENETLAQRASMLTAMIDYRQYAQAEIERCKLMDIDPPDFVPHPDNIEICWQTGEVTITGPISPEDKKQLEHWRSEMVRFEDELGELNRELEAPENTDFKAHIQEDIAHVKNCLGLFEQIVLQILNKRTVTGG